MYEDPKNRRLRLVLCCQYGLIDHYTGSQTLAMVMGYVTCRVGEKATDLVRCVLPTPQVQNDLDDPTKV